jgi:DNA-binding transcriptional MerR regulator
MTPKEQAGELIIRYYSDSDLLEDLHWTQAKQCALIAVKEIKEAIDWHKYAYPIEEHDYWEKVEQEIPNL